MQDIILIVAGLVFAGLIIYGVYSAFTSQDETSKKKGLLWVVGGLAGLLVTFLGALKRKGKVVVVEPHVRTKAPTDKKQADLDADADSIKDRSDQADKDDQLAGADDKLDDERKKLEDQARDTDQKLEDIAKRDGDSDDPTGHHTADPDLAKRLREGGRPDSEHGDDGEGV